VLNVTGDRFAAEWPIAEFSAPGVSYTQCEQNKSELYLAFIPVTNSCGVELPDDKRLLTQLRRLERKRGRAGKDSIDHPPRLHDDLANSVAGVSYLLNTAKPSQHEFNPALHVARERLKVVTIRPGGIGAAAEASGWPLFVGLSHGDGVAASVIAQAYNNEIRVFFGAVGEQTTLRTHLSETKSWLATNVRRLRVLGAYEDTADNEIKWETGRIAQEILGGEWRLVSKPWELRRDSLLHTLTQAQPFTFKPQVQLDLLGTRDLSQALNRPFYEKEKAEKKNYHLINAFTLLLSRLELWKATPKDPKPPRLPPSAMSA
jgi:hypothetical protein